MRLEKKFVKRASIVLVAVVILLLITAISVYANRYYDSQSAIALPTIDKNTALRNANHAFDKLDPGASVESIQLTQKYAGDEPLWEAHSSQSGDVCTSATNGKVRYIFREKGIDEALSYVKNSYPTISKANALSHAKDQITNIGALIPESAPDEASMFKDNDGEDGTYRWSFKWARESRGYKYHDDWIFVLVDAYRGGLIGYNLKHTSAEPTSYDINISKEKATEGARGTAIKGITGIKPETARLMIVNPNYRWFENHVEFSTDAKLAWVVDFDKTDGSGEIWVDTVTGEILGGEETR